MRKTILRFLFGACLASMAGHSSPAMECRWVRTTGQFPVEGQPLAADLTGDGLEEVVLLNRGGQILLWDGAGNQLGKGQDGLVGQIEEGVWTSKMAWVESPSGSLLIACSLEGLVVAWDTKFNQVWRFSLPGKTQYGRAYPAVLGTGLETKLVFGDLSGAVTYLDLQGKPVWTRGLDAGPVRAPVSVLDREEGAPDLLVGAGKQLFRLNPAGEVVWQCPLEDPILSKPEVSMSQQGRQIVCGAGSGSLFGISPEGTVRWKTPLGDQIDTSIAFLPPQASSTVTSQNPLILCLGVYGNLHAIGQDGKRVWSHFFEAKSRAAPLILAGERPDEVSILVPTYKHHLYVFDGEGNLKDDFRLGGIPGGSAVALPGVEGAPPDVLVVAASLMAYRLSPGTARPTYRGVGKPGTVSLAFREGGDGKAGLVVENPEGGLVRVDLQTISQESGLIKTGRLSVQSSFEIPLPEEFLGQPPPVVLAVARNATGEILCTSEQTFDGRPDANLSQGDRVGPLGFYPTWPYSDFDETGQPSWLVPDRPVGATVEVADVYVGEIDQGAWILENLSDRPMQVRVTCGRPTRRDGAVFGGSLILRKAVSTGTVNGERVADALPEVGDAGVIDLPARQAAKMWLSVDAHEALPGNYHADLLATPLMGEMEPIRIPLSLEVVDLRLPDRLPFAVCTWDYIPNQWFPENTQEALADMNRHGVNVFPRHSCMPKGKVDSEGELTVDWKNLDDEIDRLNGHGTILFQVQHPPIDFPGEMLEQDRRPFEVEYLRRFRDRLAKRGRQTGDYAFYPTDEPGYEFGKRVGPMLEAADLFHEADSAFRVYTDPVMAFSRADFERSRQAIDVWAPNMRFVSGALSGDPRIAQMLSSGQEVWSYECVAQVKSLSPLRYNRAYAWRAKYFGLQGMGFWTHSTTPTDPWVKGKGISDEFALVYPGEKPIPSVRWEAVRDGIEDIAAVELLQSRIVRAEAAGTDSETVAEAKRYVSLVLNDIMEVSDGAFIESRDYLAQGNRRIWHTPTDEQAYRALRAEIADLSLRLKE